MQNKELVILLHGMLRKDTSMLRMERFFKRNNYTTINILYPSTKKSLEELSSFVHEKIIASPQYNKDMKLNFVTHSMGGLITRYYISIYKPENMGNVVMLGPPNRGSELADWLNDTKALKPLFKKIYGPAGGQLTTGYQHKYNDINYPLGVIAGTRSINPLAPWFLDRKNDGMVSVERTKIEGMSDHIIIKTSHALMMFSKRVMQQSLNFLRNNKFDHSEKAVKNSKK